MTKIQLFSDAAAMESMRSSDFDVYSAMGEVIDNSVQAHAKNIKVDVKYESTGTKIKKEPISCVVFGDDGDGMPVDILHRCLQIGFSSRFNDRSGIGRFGVGAILGAINQCKRVELYSKTAAGKWYYTYIDLDEIGAKPPQMDAIPAPIEKAPPTDLAKLAGKDQGTLVIWKKYDKQPTDASEIVKELNIWVGRTFRKFIWGVAPDQKHPIAFEVNGEEIKAIDPLYATTDKTRFEKDSPAKKFKTITIPWPISEDGVLKSGAKNKESIVHIDMSLLPLELRPNRGAGNSKAVEERFIDQNNGISILRNGREVFYGPIPYWPGDRFEEIDRWWGCEVSFDAVLDKEFMVKNIKRGAVPIKELKKTISDAIDPTRKTCLEEVRSDWEKAKKAEENKNANAGDQINTSHSKVEKAVKKAVTPTNVLDKDKDLDQEAQDYSDKYLKECNEREKAQWIAKFKSQPFTIMEDSWRGGDFMEVKHLGGSSILSYNTSHKFFAELDAIRKEMQKEDTDNPCATRLKNLIDLLMMSYAKAEAMVDAGMTIPAETLLEQLRMNWGHSLANYIETFKREEGEE